MEPLNSEGLPFFPVNVGLDPAIQETFGQSKYRGPMKLFNTLVSRFRGNDSGKGMTIFPVIVGLDPIIRKCSGNLNTGVR
jgi:hypothetical protein